jgi:superfamily I DNA/RNA helicase
MGSGWVPFMPSVGASCAGKQAYLPVDQNFVIYDADDQLALIKRVIKERRFNESDYRPNQVLARISNAKNDLLGPDEYPLISYRDETIKASLPGLPGLPGRQQCHGF